MQARCIPCNKIMAEDTGGEFRCTQCGTRIEFVRGADASRGRPLSMDALYRLRAAAHELDMVVRENT